jgi:hypothetical protein
MRFSPGGVSSGSQRNHHHGVSGHRHDSTKWLGSTKWLDNALLDAWIQAAANNPSEFAVPVFFPRALRLAAFPATNNFALSIRLHQEWSLLSQLVWDHAFATATGVRDGNMALRLRHYAQSLVTANNKAKGDSDMSQIWGYVDSIYSHPFLARLRAPSDDSLGENRGKWAVFSEANEGDLPNYIQPVPCLRIVLPPRKEPVCPSIRSTFDPPPESPHDGDIFNLLGDPPSDQVAPADLLIAQSGKRSLQFDPFAC